MSSNPTARPRKVVDFQFHSLRNISCPEDLENGRKVYVGQAPITSILGLPTDENVRMYLLEAEGRKKQTPTQVHLAMRETLANSSHNFSVLNGGIVIVARLVEVDDKTRMIRLTQPSIINGSQTQGILSDFIDAKKTKKEEVPNIHVKFEVIETDDEDLIAETSISRNFQNDVMTLSIAGRLHQLDELEDYLRAKRPHSKLMKSETDLSSDYVKTEKLLQVIAALIPAELWPIEAEKDGPNKVFTYSMKARCLKMFRDIYEKAKDPKHPEHQKNKRLYEFYLEIAAEGLDLYYKWKSHQGFKGSRLLAISRDSDGKILEVPDGIVFPILAALSAFAKKTSSGWSIQPPSMFKDDLLIKSAVRSYQEIAKSNPQSMGKNKACYSALLEIAEIYREFGSR
jgi:hypothetical protein